MWIILYLLVAVAMTTVGAVLLLVVITIQANPRTKQKWEHTLRSYDEFVPVNVYPMILSLFSGRESLVDLFKKAHPVARTLVWSHLLAVPAMLTAMRLACTQEITELSTQGALSLLMLLCTVTASTFMHASKSKNGLVHGSQLVRVWSNSLFYINRLIAMLAAVFFLVLWASTLDFSKPIIKTLLSDVSFRLLAMGLAFALISEYTKNLVVYCSTYILWHACAFAAITCTLLRVQAHV